VGIEENEGGGGGKGREREFGGRGGRTESGMEGKVRVNL